MNRSQIILERISVAVLQSVGGFLLDLHPDDKVDWPLLAHVGWIAAAAAYAWIRAHIQITGDGVTVNI